MSEIFKKKKITKDWLSSSALQCLISIQLVHVNAY